MMGTLKELSTQYRKQCAVLAIRIKELTERGEDRERISILREMLKEAREVADTMENYYTGERSQRITLGGSYGAKFKRETD